jgi:hypothetical protein
VVGGFYIGALVGKLSNGTINGCYVEGGKVYGYSWPRPLEESWYFGGIVGSSEGVISNSYSSASVRANFYAGGVVGYNAGTMTNCYSTGTVLCDRQYAGGLTGKNKGAISNCCSTSDVVGIDPVGSGLGGLVGINEGTISGCYAEGSISGDYAGGLVGFNWLSGEPVVMIINCYSSGSVSGGEFIGGLVGRNAKEIINCYFVGSVSGNTDVGGLVGNDAGGSYNKSFWDSDVNPDVNGIGNTTDPDVIGESTTNMQTESMFTDAGWDFVGETVNGPNDIWDICEGMNYPKLSLQIPPLGDFICPDGVNFFDFSFFAGSWAEENCGVSNDCDGRDLDLLGSVDIKDLRIFADNWLAGF